MVPLRTVVRVAAWRALVALAASLVVACGSGASPATPAPCDQTCQDATAIQSLRDAIKLAYNLTLQGKPVGPQDGSSPCPLGGTVHVSGTATSNAAVGSTSVTLTYEFAGCAFAQTDTDPKQTYQMTLTGSITENGTIAQQPSSTTALDFASASMTFSGTVYSPPITYGATGCGVTLGQNGNQIAGTMCGRAVGLTL